MARKAAKPGDCWEWRCAIWEPFAGKDAASFSLLSLTRLEAAFQRSLASGRKPTSLFALIQELYDGSTFPQTGVAGGELLFETLFSLLRGRDGTERGEQVYQIYLGYRNAALEYKNAYKTANPEAIQAARKKRKTWLQACQRNLTVLAGLYARREAVLNPNFQIERKMLEGFEPALRPIALSAPRLTIFHGAGRAVVLWKGGAHLQQAPSLFGPWSNTQKSSPASFDLRQQHLFFRTMQPGTRTSQ
jgi:hypothetical protein